MNRRDFMRIGAILPVVFHFPELVLAEPAAIVLPSDGWYRLMFHYDIRDDRMLARVDCLLGGLPTLEQWHVDSAIDEPRVMTKEQWEDRILAPMLCVLEDSVLAKRPTRVYAPPIPAGYDVRPPWELA